MEAAFAGDMEAAHLAGCEHVLRHCGVKAVPAPVVVTGNGGSPRDRDLYQVVAALLDADRLCEPGGVIISVNQCEPPRLRPYADEAVPAAGRTGRDGTGNVDEAESQAVLEARLEAAWSGESNAARPDRRMTRLAAGLLRRRKVIVVSGVAPELIRDLGMIPAPYLGAALKMADEITGLPNAPITVLPEAGAVAVN